MRKNFILFIVARFDAKSTRSGIYRNESIFVCNNKLEIACRKSVFTSSDLLEKVYLSILIKYFIITNVGFDICMVLCHLIVQ